MSIERVEDTQQTLLELARKMCRNMRSSYFRTVYEINGVKYDILCKKSSKGKYCAEVQHVCDIKAEKYTIRDAPCDVVLYQFNHSELKE